MEMAGRLCASWLPAAPSRSVALITTGSVGAARLHSVSSHDGVRSRATIHAERRCHFREGLKKMRKSFCVSRLPQQRTRVERERSESGDVVELAHAKAIEAHVRANTTHNAAKADVESFEHLDGVISSTNAGKLRVAIATGAASPDLGSLPEHLADERAKRTAAFEKLNAVHDVHAELAADLQTSEQAIERRKYELDLAIESVVAEDAEALAAEWLADLAALRKRFWTFEAISGRKIRNDPDLPPVISATGNVRPFHLGKAIHEIVIGSRGVIGGDDAITEQQAKAVAVGEFVLALHKDDGAKMR
jgi:hypothetical protein